MYRFGVIVRLFVLVAQSLLSSQVKAETQEECLRNINNALAGCNNPNCSAVFEPQRAGCYSLPGDSRTEPQASQPAPAPYSAGARASTTRRAGQRAVQASSATRPAGQRTSQASHETQRASFKAPLLPGSCVLVRTQQGGANITQFGNELFAYVSNRCSVPIKFSWCWKYRGQSSCQINSISDTIMPGSESRIYGPTPDQTTSYHAIVCDVSTPSLSCVP